MEYVLLLPLILQIGKLSLERLMFPWLSRQINGSAGVKPLYDYKVPKHKCSSPSTSQSYVLPILGKMSENGDKDRRTIALFR